MGRQSLFVRSNLLNLQSLSFICSRRGFKFSQAGLTVMTMFQPYKLAKVHSTAPLADCLVPKLIDSDSRFASSAPPTNIIIDCEIV